jgi:hypothetical protein
MPPRPPPLSGLPSSSQSNTTAAVQDCSGEPRGSPVNGSKYSAKPPSAICWRDDSRNRSASWYSPARQRPPQKPVDHRPDWPPPVATMVELRIVRTGARRQRPSESRVTDKRRRHEGLQEDREAPGPQASGHQRGEGGHGASTQSSSCPQVVIETEPEFRVPAPLHPLASALDPVGDQYAVFDSSPTSPAMSSKTSLAAMRIALKSTSLTRNGCER